MEQKTAFVSGGSSGIGFAIAKSLLEAGYAVTVSSRRPERLYEVAESLTEIGEVHAVPGDFSQEEDIEAIAASHRERYGRLDVLVNNAGLGSAETVDQITTKRLDLQLAVNLRGYILCTRSLIDLLAEQPKSNIINLASVAGIYGESTLSVYSATKAGVIGFSKAIQREWGDKGVRATALCPAWVDTPMVEWISEKVGRENMITVEDVASMAMTIVNLSPACVIQEVAFELPGGGLPGID